MSLKHCKILVERTAQDGQKYQSLERVYDYSRVMQDFYGKVGNSHVIADGFDGKIFQGWRNRIKQYKDITGRLIPTDDKRHIIKIYRIIRLSGNVIIVDTQFGKCSINDHITWDNARMGILGGFGKEKSYDWLHDDNKKKCFAWVYLNQAVNGKIDVRCRHHSVRALKKRVHRTEDSINSL